MPRMCFARAHCRCYDSLRKRRRRNRLNLASRNDGWSRLSALELVARSGGGEFTEIGGAEVGQRMALEPCLQELHRIQVWRVRRHERHLNLSVRGIDLLAHQLAAVRFQSVPDDQPRALQMRAQRFEELSVCSFLIEPSYMRSRHWVWLTPAMTEMCFQLK